MKKIELREMGKMAKTPKEPGVKYTGPPHKCMNPGCDNQATHSLGYRIPMNYTQSNRDADVPHSMVVKKVIKRLNISGNVYKDDVGERRGLEVVCEGCRNRRVVPSSRTSNNLPDFPAPPSRIQSFEAGHKKNEPEQPVFRQQSLFD